MIDLPLFVTVGRRCFNPRHVVNAGQLDYSTGEPTLTLSLFPADLLTFTGEDAEAWAAFAAENSRVLTPRPRSQARAEECPVPADATA